MSFLKPDVQEIEQGDVLALHNQQTRGNNPNLFNAFGSSQTTFGADGQPTITQELSPEMQALLGQQIGMLQGGPTQITPFGNSGLESIFSGLVNSGAQRGGRDPKPQPQQNQIPPPNGTGQLPPQSPLQPSPVAQPVQQPPPLQQNPVQPIGGGNGDGRDIELPPRQPKSLGQPASPLGSSIEGVLPLLNSGGFLSSKESAIAQQLQSLFGA